MVFSTRIFQIWIWDWNGLCIISRLERVVVVRPTYVLFSLETQSPKGYLNMYTMFILSRSSVKREELLEIIRLEFSNLL